MAGCLDSSVGTDSPSCGLGRVFLFFFSSGFNLGLLRAADGMAGWLGRDTGFPLFLGGRIVGSVGMKLCLAAGNVYVIIPVVRLFALDGPEGFGGWGWAIQRSEVVVAHDVEWRDDGLNVAVSQRGVDGDCTLLHKL